MKKRMIVILAAGFICIILGVILAGLNISPKIVPAVLVAFGCASAAVYISTKGGTLILDEMVKRIDALSGHYSFVASMFFVLALSIINYFYSMPLSVAELLLTITMFMSFSYMFIRYFLMKWGKAE